MTMESRRHLLMDNLKRRGVAKIFPWKKIQIIWLCLVRYLLDQLSWKRKWIFPKRKRYNCFDLCQDTRRVGFNGDDYGHHSLLQFFILRISRGARRLPWPRSGTTFVKKVSVCRWAVVFFSVHGCSSVRCFSSVRCCSSMRCCLSVRGNFVGALLFANTRLNLLL